MSLRWCESPGNAARTAALSADQAPTAIIGCPHMTMPPHDNAPSAVRFWRWRSPQRGIGDEQWLCFELIALIADRPTSFVNGEP
jgi:hypothetical protein